MPCTNVEIVPQNHQKALLAFPHPCIHRILLRIVQHRLTFQSLKLQHRHQKHAQLITLRL